MRKEGPAPVRSARVGEKGHGGEFTMANDIKDNNAAQHLFTSVRLAVDMDDKVAHQANKLEAAHLDSMYF